MEAKPWPKSFKSSSCTVMIIKSHTIKSVQLQELPKLQIYSTKLRKQQRILSHIMLHSHTQAWVGNWRCCRNLVAVVCRPTGIASSLCSEMCYKSQWTNKNTWKYQITIFYTNFHNKDKNVGNKMWLPFVCL